MQSSSDGAAKLVSEIEQTIHSKLHDSRILLVCRTLIIEDVYTK